MNLVRGILRHSIAAWQGMAQDDQSFSPSQRRLLSKVSDCFIWLAYAAEGRLIEAYREHRRALAEDRLLRSAQRFAFPY